MIENRSTLRLRSFQAALDRLDDALAQPKTEWTRDKAEMIRPETCEARR